MQWLFLVAAVKGLIRYWTATHLTDSVLSKWTYFLGPSTGSFCRSLHFPLGFWPELALNFLHFFVAVCQPVLLYVIKWIYTLTTTLLTLMPFLILYEYLINAENNSIINAKPENSLTFCLTKLWQRFKLWCLPWSKSTVWRFLPRRSFGWTSCTSRRRRKSQKMAPHKVTATKRTTIVT